MPISLTRRHQRPLLVAQDALERPGFGGRLHHGVDRFLGQPFRLRRHEVEADEGDVRRRDADRRAVQLRWTQAILLRMMASNRFHMLKTFKLLISEK